MKTKLYKKSFITKTALDNFSQTFQGKKRTIIECGNSCTRQNASCNAIHYDHDTQVCSMWNLDSKYCINAEFTSGFTTPAGQTEELLGLFLGSELFNIPCPCTDTSGTPCAFPWKHATRTNNALVWGCTPLDFGSFGKGYNCPISTDADGTASTFHWCDMTNDACKVAEGYEPWPEGTELIG